MKLSLLLISLCTVTSREFVQDEEEEHMYYLRKKVRACIHMDQNEMRCCK